MKTLLKAWDALWGKTQGSFSAYEGASPKGRLRPWQASPQGINALHGASLETLRQRSRDTARNNPYAARALETLTTNVVGTGIKAYSKAPDLHLRSRIQEVWEKWCARADLDGAHDFYGLQSLMLRSMLEGGECFIRFVVLEEARPIPLKLQVLEAEHLHAKHLNWGKEGFLKEGIELNAKGQRIAYHLLKAHPGEGSLEESVRIPAQDLIHFYRPLRPGQLRGEPWLTPILLKLHELDQYEDAELNRKKTTAMFTGFLTRLDLGQKTPSLASDPDPYLSLEPGILQTLAPGEDIKFSEPSDVGGNYEAFIRQQLRSMATGLSITYEQLTGDLTGVNYSSIRAGLLEFRRRAEMLQNLMIYKVCQPIWERFLGLACLSGALELDSSETPELVKWQPHGWRWVDPLKDLQAHVLAVEHGFKSRTDVVSEMGYDIDEIDHESKILDENHSYGKQKINT